MFKSCARILKSIVGRAACKSPQTSSETEGSNPEAADWLPPVLGSAEWPLATMVDRSAVWYLDRR